MTQKSPRGRPSTAQQKIKAKNAKEAEQEAANRAEEPIGLENDMDSEQHPEIHQIDATAQPTDESEPQEAARPDEETAYHCLNCKSPVSRTDVRCPVCELKLQWEYMDVTATA
jgi:hypothetical protein